MQKVTKEEYTEMFEEIIEESGFQVSDERLENIIAIMDAVESHEERIERNELLNIFQQAVAMSDTYNSIEGEETFTNISSDKVRPLAEVMINAVKKELGKDGEFSSLHYIDDAALELEDILLINKKRND